MLAYRKSDFDALALRAALDEWSREGLIDAHHSASIAASLAEKSPLPFYMPNLFIRIGLFIFGAICAFSVLGLAFLMLEGAHSDREDGFLLLLFCAGLIAVVELLIRREKPFFRAGLEEAFLYGALGCLLPGMLMAFEISGQFHYPMAMVMMAALAAAALRYADSLLSVAAMAMGLFALYDFCSRCGNLPIYVLPLLVIFLSACVVRSAGRALAKPALRYWAHLWALLRLFALFTCYAGGNYFVIRELSHLVFHHGVSVDQEIPCAFLFYLFTFGLPFAYLAVGLMKKDRQFLLAGLITAALAVATFKYYHHVMPVETALVLAGPVLIALAWIALRFLREVRWGLTTSAIPGSAGKGVLNAESLAMLQSFSSKDAPHQAPPGAAGMQGGGGSFGGGGAGGNF